MYNKLTTGNITFLRTHPNQLPTVIIYKKLITAAVAKFKINTEETRDKFRLLTNKQWLNLLFTNK